MRTLTALAAILAAASMMTGCASSPAADPTPPDPKVLRVGITPNAPPMIFQEDGKIVGAEADFAQALGGQLGRQVVFVPMKWDQLIEALCDRRVDIIMSAMSITPTRRYRIAFSEPYLKVSQMVLVREEDKYSFVMGFDTLAKRGIGVIKDTTADFLLRQEHTKAKLKYYDSGQDAATALLRKNVDLFINDSPMIWYLASVYETKGLTVAPMRLSEELLGWGVRREDQELCNAVNAFLAKVQQNGEFNLILRRWMPNFQ